MKIRKLELSGFKSFVDPTILELSTGISAIVGPNGGGKSNLVDALRWVLGEQSPSRLRGGAMEDVLFNGSAHRGPVGMAEVSLLLENDGWLAGDELPEALRDVAEILVTRRYFRSGESEYLINRRPCRLKDITGLFLGTGAGTRAYSLIEQGKVDQLVTAKPEEIRLFIEEVAGTTRYRSCRIAAERKLERTRDNLYRANDMLREIDRSIAIFQRMAKRPEQYRRLQEELRHVELQLGRRRRDRLTAEIDAAEGRYKTLHGRDRALGSSIESLEGERVTARRDLAALEEELRGQQEVFFDLRSRRERSEARLEILDRDSASAGERVLRLEGELAQLVERSTRASEESGALEADLAALVEQRRIRGGELEASLQSASTEEAGLARLGDMLEGAKNEIVELLSREAELRNRISAVEQREGERRAEGDRLAEELRTLGADVVRRASDLERIVSRRSEIESRFDVLERQLEGARGRAEASRSQREALEQAGVALARSLAEAESRLEGAEEVERGFSRYQEGVRTIMQRHQERPNGVLDLVARVLEAPPEVERAVAAVLGARLQYVIVRRPKDACEAIEELHSLGAGRSSFVPMESVGGASISSSGVVPEHLAGGPRLIDLIRVEEGYVSLAEKLLGDAVLVDDLPAALELHRKNGVARTVVTRDGSVFRPDGVISGGSEAPYEEQILAHGREVRRLRDDLTRLLGEQSALELRHGEVAREAAAGAAYLEALEAERRELAPARVGIQKDEERARDGLARVGGQKERGEAGKVRIETEIEELGTVLLESRAGLVEAITTRERLQRDRSGLDQSLTDRRVALELRTRAATDLKVELAQLAEKESRLRETIERLHGLKTELEDRSTAIEEEIRDLGERATSAAGEADGLRVTLEDTRRREGEHGTTVEAARAKATERRDRIDELERRLEAARAELDDIRSTRSGVELQRAEKAMHRDALEAEIRERYEFDLATVEIEVADEDDLASRFEHLRDRVDRLGASKMGMEAVGELEEEQKRREFLLTQKTDLESSVANLQKTIASLNRASRDRFTETFDAVNGKFQETFPKLFHGGHARLQFTDESNLLESGVDIQVQPPGMKLRTLSLLSGGQKALTAVSLMFSLFLCRPSPFCVLDEADAPLDDANIDRFNGIVSEMGQDSQFLLITHNKRTMEVADTLYGVTMEEPGVSKIVSVRFQRAA